MALVFEFVLCMTYYSVVNKWTNVSGKYTWPDGKIYEGQYLNDVKHGKGNFDSGFLMSISCITSCSQGNFLGRMVTRTRENFLEMFLQESVCSFEKLSVSL
jgi:hypothetical protein